jgi:hypothetical protein
MGPCHTDVPTAPASPGEPGAGAVPLDTCAEAHGVQREVYRRMGGCGRVAVAFRLSDAVRRTAQAGIRARHPEYGDEQVRLAYARLALGDALVRAAWPGRDLIDP